MMKRKEKRLPRNYKFATVETRINIGERTPAGTQFKIFRESGQVIGQNQTTKEWFQFCASFLRNYDLWKVLDAVAYTD